MAWPAPATITSGRELRTVLAQIRRDRTAYCHEELTVGAVSCAAPIAVPDASLVAAVSVVVTAGTDVIMLAAAVRTAANGISRQLCATGMRHPPGAAGAPALAAIGT